MASEAQDLKSELEDLDEVTKRLKVSIPAEKVESEFKDAIGDLARTVALKGFRKGKAPRTVVEKMHGSRVRMEIANRLISESLNKLVNEMKIDMVGVPEIDISSFEPGEEINYTAEISIFPNPEVSGYEKFDLEVERREIEDRDVDDAISELQERHASLKRLDFRTAAKAGDVVDASVSVQIGSQDPSRPEPVHIRLGDKTLPEEVEKQLEGLELLQTREINIQIPETHPDKNLRGQKATYKVTLNALSERVLPELNDEFAKKCDLGVETVLELRMKVRELLEKNAQSEADRVAREMILKELAQKNEFKVPQAIVDDQIRSMLVQFGVLNPQKVDPSRISVEQFREKLGVVALERVRSTIVVDRIAEKEKLAATEDEIKKHLEEIAEDSNLSLEEVQKYFKEKSRLVELALEMTRTKTLDLLASRAKINFVAPIKSAEDIKKEE
ncbi:MAG: trigger factor [Bdellovibrionales bacterium]|nr:trigger factor [Bdellovibrionales bacterium]